MSPSQRKDWATKLARLRQEDFCRIGYCSGATTIEELRLRIAEFMK